MYTSLPDISELPTLFPGSIPPRERAHAYAAWFAAAAALLLRKLSPRACWARASEDQAGGDGASHKAARARHKSRSLLLAERGSVAGRAQLKLGFGRDCSRRAPAGCYALFLQSDVRVQDAASGQVGGFREITSPALMRRWQYMPACP